MKGCCCDKCIECCKREPGWFMPGDIGPAATFLGLSEEEFISKYCEEHLEDGVLALSPSRKPEKTECVFLDENGLCKIHPVKPYECGKVFGCEPAARHKRIREIIKKRWAK